jgi:Raf kinase inhibitor-like YbhB/YbcL family protein
MTDYEGPEPFKRLSPRPYFTLTSTDIAEGEPLPPAQFGAASGGSDVSPQLSWSGFPPETKSFVITAYDPDAPTSSGYWHWAVADIPASVTEIAAGAGTPGSPVLPAESVTLPNEARITTFIGAGPPEGTGVHRYFFTVHAVDVPSLELDPSCTPAVLGFNLHFHSIARAVLMATGEFGGAA